MPAQIAMKSRREQLYRKWLAGAAAVWLTAGILLASGLPAPLFNMISCLAGVAIAPAIASLITTLCIVGLVLFPKHKRILQAAGELFGQFAVSIDSFLNILPGNPFAFGMSDHKLKLAIVLSDHQQFKESDDLLCQVLESIERDEGPGSLCLVEPLSLRLAALRALGNFDQAAACADRLLAISEQNKGDCQLFIGAALADLCIAYSKQGRIQESESIGEKAVKVLENLRDEQMQYGKEGMIAIALNNLGCVYEDSCKYDRARQLYERALEMKKRVMKEGDPSIGVGYANVAQSLLHQEKFELAVENIERAIEIFEKAGQTDGAHWASAQEALGAAYRGLGRLPEAEVKLMEAMRMKEKLLAPHDPGLADCYIHLAMLYRDLKDFEKADQLFRKALVLLESALGVDHPQIARLLKEYGKLLKTCGREDDLAIAEERIRSLEALLH